MREQSHGLGRGRLQGGDEHAEVGVARQDGREVAGDGQDTRDDLRASARAHTRAADLELEVGVASVAADNRAILADREAAVLEALDLDDLAGVARKPGVGLVVEHCASEALRGEHIRERKKVTFGVVGICDALKVP